MAKLLPVTHEHLHIYEKHQTLVTLEIWGWQIYAPSADIQHSIQITHWLTVFIVSKCSQTHFLPHSYTSSYVSGTKQSDLDPQTSCVLLFSVSVSCYNRAESIIQRQTKQNKRNEYENHRATKVAPTPLHLLAICKAPCHLCESVQSTA
jgi:hypothetical protein